MLLDEIDRMNGLLEELGQVGRPHPLARKRLRVGQVLESMHRLMAPAARQQGIDVLVTVSSNVPVISTDFARLKQRFIHLTKNTREAMPEGGEIQLSAQVVEGYVRILVEDNGPGLPPPVANNLSAHHVSDKPGGMGVGLRVCHQMAIAHSGHLEVARTSSHGTVFALMLPVSACAVAGLARIRSVRRVRPSAV
jgi:signal transduction histidine kinase